MTALIIFIIATLIISHVGVAWSGVLLSEGNIFDWLPKYIEKIKPKKLQNLLECPKCVSGQFALWTYVGVSIHYDVFHWFFSIMFGIAWVCWIVAITAWFYKLYDYK